MLEKGLAMNATEVAYRVSAEKHKHLCPRQILGVRMGIYAGELLGFAFPQQKKEVLAIAETDGCFLDGIVAATGCEVGRRTMRIEDYGKVAATFVIIATGKAIRISPKDDIRQTAQIYAPNEANRWEMMQKAYQSMPLEALFNAKQVQLVQAIEDIISRAGVRVNCDVCREEIINEREIRQAEQILCRSCAGPAYYQAEIWSVGPSIDNHHHIVSNNVLLSRT